MHLEHVIVVTEAYIPAQTLAQGKDMASGLSWKGLCGQTGHSSVWFSSLMCEFDFWLTGFCQYEIST